MAIARWFILTNASRPKNNEMENLKKKPLIMWKTESAKAHEVIKLGLVRLMGVGVGVYDGKDLWIFCLYLERGK